MIAPIEAQTVMNMEQTYKQAMLRKTQAALGAADQIHHARRVAHGLLSVPNKNSAMHT